MKKIFVNIKRLEFYKNENYSENYESNAPIYGIDHELNSNYGFTNEDEFENYYLLSNYYNNSFSSRGILLNLMFRSSPIFRIPKVKAEGKYSHVQ